MLRAAAAHPGASLIEIYQNCPVFNDGAFDALTDKQTRAANVVELEHGEPIRFGAELEHGIVRDGDGELRGRGRRERRRGRAAAPRRAPRGPEPRVRAQPPRRARGRGDADRDLPRGRPRERVRRADAPSSPRTAPASATTNSQRCCTTPTPGPSAADRRGRWRGERRRAPAHLTRSGARRSASSRAPSARPTRCYLDLEAARAAGHPDLVAPPMFAVVYCGRAIEEAMLDPEVGLDFAMLAARRPGVRVGAARARRRRDHHLGASSPRSPSGSACASTSSSPRSANQRGEEVCAGRWTQIVRPRA